MRVGGTLQDDFCLPVGPLPPKAFTDITTQWLKRRCRVSREFHDARHCSVQGPCEHGLSRHAAMSPTRSLFTDDGECACSHSYQNNLRPVFENARGISTSLQRVTLEVWCGQSRMQGYKRLQICQSCATKAWKTTCKRGTQRCVSCFTKPYES